MSKHDEDDDPLFPDGYVGLRNGLLEHINAGCFIGYDLSVYVYLHYIAKWQTGIAYTCASAIGEHQKIPTTSVNNSLHRLRERGYINYPKGKGKHGLYLIAINKAVPTAGVLTGYRLDAFSDNNLESFTYTSPNGDRAEAVLKRCGDRAETVLMRCGDGVLTVRIPDNIDNKDNINGKTEEDETKEKAFAFSTDDDI